MHARQDTGEHGSTNSWDRQPLLYRDDNGVLQHAPAPRHIHRNFVFRNSFRGPTSNKWVWGEGTTSYKWVWGEGTTSYKGVPGSTTTGSRVKGQGFAKDYLTTGSYK